MNEHPASDARQRVRAWVEQPRVVGALLLLIVYFMTLESWSMGIARPVMENFPYAWAFFVPFILVATFTMLNLFNAMLAVGTTSPSPNLTAKANP